MKSSRKEREQNYPSFDLKKGAKFIDDFKRLAKGFPEAAVKVRELAGATDADFVIIVAGDPAHPVKASDTKFEGRLERARDQCLFGGGQLPHRIGEEVRRKTWHFCGDRKAVQEAAARGDAGAMVDGALAFQPIWITDFPMFEYDAVHWRNGCRRIIHSPHLTRLTWLTS